MCAPSFVDRGVGVPSSQNRIGLREVQSDLVCLSKTPIFKALGSPNVLRAINPPPQPRRRTRSIGSYERCSWRLPSSSRQCVASALPNVHNRSERPLVFGIEDHARHLHENALDTEP